MKKQNIGLAFVLGAIAGGVSMLFMPQDKQKKGKKILTDKAAKLKKDIVDLYDREEVQEIFGVDSKTVGKNLAQAREHVNSQLDALKSKVDQLDKTQYLNVVNKAIKMIEKQGELTKTQLQRLEKHLNDQYGKPKQK